MFDLALISGVPGVKSAVLGDLAGGYLDAVREPDGESVAAVMGFLSSTMGQAGDQLGLGELRRISFAGALCTPRSLSLRAQIPAMWPDGGTRTLSDSPSGSATRTHG